MRVGLSMGKLWLVGMNRVAISNGSAAQRSVHCPKSRKIEIA